jgi:hypothetical protein
VEVTLLKPPPLERALRVEQAAAESVLWDSDQMVAKARSVKLELEVPEAPSFEAAQRSALYYLGFAEHIYPECFVCGPSRAPGDALRIFPGRAHPEDPVAAPWTPDPSLADAEGKIHPEFVWAALDCPGYFALGQPIVAVLGRMTASIEQAVTAGKNYSVVGWKLRNEGRKYFAATALFSERGELLAQSMQVWIRLH